MPFLIPPKQQLCFLLLAITLFLFYTPILVRGASIPAYGWLGEPDLDCEHLPFECDGKLVTINPIHTIQAGWYVILVGSDSDPIEASRQAIACHDAIVRRSPNLIWRDPDVDICFKPRSDGKGWEQDFGKSSKCPHPPEDRCTYGEFCYTDFYPLHSRPCTSAQGAAESDLKFCTDYPVIPSSDYPPFILNVTTTRPWHYEFSYTVPGWLSFVTAMEKTEFGAETPADLPLNVKYCDTENAMNKATAHYPKFIDGRTTETLYPMEGPCDVQIWTAFIDKVIIAFNEGKQNQKNRYQVTHTFENSPPSILTEWHNCYHYGPASPTPYIHCRSYPGCDFPCDDGQSCLDDAACGSGWCFEEFTSIGGKCTSDVGYVWKPNKILKVTISFPKGVHWADWRGPERFITILNRIEKAAHEHELLAVNDCPYGSQFYSPSPFYPHYPTNYKGTRSVQLIPFEGKCDFEALKSLHKQAIGEYNRGLDDPKDKLKITVDFGSYSLSDYLYCRDHPDTSTLHGVACRATDSGCHVACADGHQCTEDGQCGSHYCKDTVCYSAAIQTVPSLLIGLLILFMVAFRHQ